VVLILATIGLALLLPSEARLAEIARQNEAAASPASVAEQASG
jgi:hypothetical protein